MTKTVVLDPYLIEELRARRRKLGLDRWDEVWDGVEHIPAPHAVAHQTLVGHLLIPLLKVVQDAGLGHVYLQLNVADPDKGFQDFRIPDICVVLRGGRAQVREAFIAGGPDLVIEIRSPGDETREKLPWYAAQGVREILVLDRDTREPTLYRPKGGAVEDAFPTERVTLETVPLHIERFFREGRPYLKVTDTSRPDRSWEV